MPGTYFMQKARGKWRPIQSAYVALSTPQFNLALNHLSMSVYILVLSRKAYNRVPNPHIVRLVLTIHGFVAAKQSSQSDKEPIFIEFCHYTK